ncbi:GAF domain-containing protein [Peribacillus simplex]|uniref:GAF domain-containing protein n=1 Tax=Peribacillus simplex TaxID=1478 RepID=UPI003337A22C
METVIVEWFKRLPDWAFVASSGIFLILLGIITYFVALGVKRFSDAAGQENRLVNLQEEHIKLVTENSKFISSTAQLQTVLINSRSFVNSLNKLMSDTDPDFSHFYLIQRIIEGIASDVKANGGERHRCGFWLEDQDKGVLYLSNGSAGFPESYIENRHLDINNSIAGRCFRKKQTINLPDVTLDTDWSPTDSSGSYKALICIPVGSWGVITIDAKEPMEENAKLIGDFYAEILEGIFNDYLNRMQEGTVNQIASELE